MTVQMPRSALYDLASGVLQAIVGGWPDEDHAAALPEQQYVANGDVQWDCAQLVVNVERVFPTQGDVTVEQWWQTDAGLGPRGCVLGVWLIRCVPDIDATGQVIKFPSAAAMDESAFDLLGDSTTVLELLLQAQLEGELATCNGFSFENWTPVGPSGGLGGGVTRVRTQLMPVGVDPDVV